MPPKDVSLAPRASASSSVSAGDANHSLWFSEHVLPHEQGLRAWLKVRFPSLADDDDIVQETYVRLIRARELRAVDNTKSYLFSVARNLVVDLFRRKRATPLVGAAELESLAVIEDRVGVAEAVCTSQEVEILQEAIEALPDRCREIMTLQKLHGLSNQAIAERLGLSVNTVNAQMVIGLARCRRYLVSRGVLRGGGS